MLYIYMLPAAFLAPIIHEWVKALCSTLLGDPTPKRTGHLTLNPLKYFEPIGFLFVLTFGFGWANPVPTAALHYKNRNLGTILTYTAPIFVNLLLGIASVVGVMALGTRGNVMVNAGLMFRIITEFHFIVTDVNMIGIILLSHFAFININIALFNLIPIYPLAANKLMIVFSSPDTIARLNHNEKMMQIILIVLLAINVIGRVFGPVAARIVILTWGIFA
ncbi:MAG: site-2 protease family protein [Defluviitaleaceae bacterium]|nr:site-2 protease family protein [Defluviitaleaceae bacterium]